MTQALRVASTGLSGDESKLLRERWTLNFLMGKAYEARITHRQTGPSKSITVRE
jgi:hypothetical protein